MTAPIGPDGGRNRYLAFLILILAVIPFVMAVSILRIVRLDEYWLALLPGVPSILLFLWAWHLWRNPPRSQTSIAFRDTGFRLTVQRKGRPDKVTDIHWADLREIAFQSGGYGVRVLDFLLTHDAALRLGLVRDTTRRDASDMLVNRKIRISPNILELSGQAVVARLTDAAEAAGFVIEKSAFRYYFFVTVERWSVHRA